MHKIEIKTDEVICDKCSKDYTNSNEQGGIILGSWAYCPECVTPITSNRKVYRCPLTLSFASFVRLFREGHNMDLGA